MNKVKCSVPGCEKELNEEDKHDHTWKIGLVNPEFLSPTLLFHSSDICWKCVNTSIIESLAVDV